MPFYISPSIFLSPFLFKQTSSVQKQHHAYQPVSGFHLKSVVCFPEGQTIRGLSRLGSRCHVRQRPLGVHSRGTCECKMVACCTVCRHKHIVNNRVFRFVNGRNEHVINLNQIHLTADLWHSKYCPYSLNWHYLPLSNGRNRKEK